MLNYINQISFKCEKFRTPLSIRGKTKSGKALILEKLKLKKVPISSFQRANSTTSKSVYQLLSSCVLLNVVLSRAYFLVQVEQFP